MDYERVAKALSQTWPAKLAKSAYDAVTLPGDVYQGNVSMWGEDGRTSTEAINRSAELASLLSGGASSMPRGANELRAGFSGRKIPPENYSGPVSRYTDELFREMSPSEALVDLPTSVASAGGGLGSNKRFYADQPSLALGQGGNRGVRVTYDAEPFVGSINTQKPGWDLLFPTGSAEYLAAPTVGKNIRETVRGFEIDRTALNKVEAAQYQRIISNLEKMGWGVERSDKKIVVTRPQNP